MYICVCMYVCMYPVSINYLYIHLFMYLSINLWSYLYICPWILQVQVLGFGRFVVSEKDHLFRVAIAHKHGSTSVELRFASIKLQCSSASRLVAEHVLHVDSCWMSAMNCSDGTVAKDTAQLSRLITRITFPLCAQDTARSLQKESVMLEMFRA